MFCLKSSKLALQSAFGENPNRRNVEDNCKESLSASSDGAAVAVASVTLYVMINAWPTESLTLLYLKKSWRESFVLIVNSGRFT